MPYNLEKSGSGFKVMGPSGAKSKRPLSKEMAVRQMRALYANEPGISDTGKKLAAMKRAKKKGKS